MLDQLQEIDISVLDELIEIKKQKETLEERLQKLEDEKENVSEDVFIRVSQDYGTQLDSLLERSTPLKDQARRQYTRLQELLETTRATLAEVRADDEELQLRHRLGEFDEDDLAERRSGIEGRLKRHSAELDALTDIRERFLAAFDSEEELNRPVVQGTVPPPEGAEASGPDEGTVLLPRLDLPASEAAPSEAEAVPSELPQLPEDGEGSEAPAPADEVPATAVQPARLSDEEVSDEETPAEDEEALAEVEVEDEDEDEIPAEEEETEEAASEEDASGDEAPEEEAAPVPPPPSGSVNEVMPPADMAEHGAAFGQAPPGSLDETEAAGSIVPPLPGMDTPHATVPPADAGTPVPAEASGEASEEQGEGTDIMKLASLIAAEPLPGGQDVYAIEPLSTIGRSPQNKVQILEPSVSRQHAEIHLRAEGYVLKDLGSENGTFVNGDPIKGECPLRDNDRVQFGTIRFIFQTEPPPV